MKTSKLFKDFKESYNAFWTENKRGGRHTSSSAHNISSNDQSWNKG